MALRTPSRPGRSRLGHWLRLPGDGIWDLELDQLDGLRRRLVGGLRVLQMVWRGFRNDECQLHASALTYYTLMSLVPILALALALARVFGGENIARERVTAEIAAWGNQLAAGAEASGAIAGDFIARLTYYSDRIFDQIGAMSFGTLGGIGLAVLFSMTVGMLSQVEHSFNRVWNAPPRTLWRKFADYLSVVLIVPFLALAASTIPVADFLARHVGGLVGNLPGMDGFAFLLKRALVALLTSTVFVFVIMFVPNTRVRLKAGVIGGVTTALFFTIWLKLCAALQIGVVKYSKLYGGFAALPIVLAWTYVSWQIVLFGAELSFALQNADTYGREQAARHAGVRARWQLALGVTVAIARAMADGTGPFDALAYARQRRISVRLLNSVMDDLLHAGLICATAQTPDRHLLVRDPAHLTAHEVVAAVLRRGTEPESLGLGNLEGNVRDLAARAEAAWDAALAPAVAALAETPDQRPRHKT